MDCGKDFVAEHSNHFCDEFSFIDLITGRTVDVPKQLEPGWSAYSADLGGVVEPKKQSTIGDRDCRFGF